MNVYRDIYDAEGNYIQTDVIAHLHEAQYSGKDMGERSITATFLFPFALRDENGKTKPLFAIGDYVELEMANFQGGFDVERFSLYTMPTVKKTARAGSIGDAFEFHLTFYPAQYELTTTLMRDMMMQGSAEDLNSKNTMYTGYDEFSIFGGAKKLMDYVKSVLDERFGKDVWSVDVAKGVNEYENRTLEQVQFDFSNNTVWDALIKLTDEGGVNTDFYIIDKTIYVGYKRPYIVGLDKDDNSGGYVKRTTPFKFMYGKTSHIPIEDIGTEGNPQGGNLYSITKSLGTQSPITRLYAYGTERNLNRFYCADVVLNGRYVNKLMLPSFSNDGKTDYIDSLRGIAKYGIREASKTFDEIYPSLRYMTYADIRSVKYVIKIEGSGKDGTDPSQDTGLATVRCYEVYYENNIAKLTPSFPPQPIAVFVHATGKTVKCVLYTSAEEQADIDYKVPTDSDKKQIEGACFCVHARYSNDYGFKCAAHTTHGTTRSDWFTISPNTGDDAKDKEIETHQINYTDDWWVTDVYEMLYKKEALSELYFDDQKFFPRDGYSAFCYARVGENYQTNNAQDNMPLNEIVAVEPITIPDTDASREGLTVGQTQFVIYLRDIGFRINQQAHSGQWQWIAGTTPQVNFLDGRLAGLSFEISGDGDGVVCAYKDNGDFNPEWFEGVDNTIAETAFNNGAIWRLILNRAESEDGKGGQYFMPNTYLNPQAEEHIVLLDIFMPDIYIRAAENRLLREAQKYLNVNDEGDISYTLELDKVRLAQVPAFGLQMREGAVMRIVDEDLQITTENEESYLANYTNPQKITVANDAVSVPIEQPFTFCAGRHYEVIIETIGAKIDATKPIILGNGLRGDVNFYDEIDETVQEENANMPGDGLRRFIVSFDLPESFNDRIDYYIYVQLNNSSVETSIPLYFFSVKESNTNELGEVANFVDLTIDSLSMKLTDSGTSYDVGVGGRAMRAGGGNGNAHNKEITATVKPKQKATTWQTMNAKIEETAIVTEKNEKTQEELANRARRYYHELEALKNNIFDPDGTIKDVFLQTMILQVGANSMNYALDNTRIFNDEFMNVEFGQNENSKWTVKIGADKLRHYVYTQSKINLGTWTIEGMASAKELTADTVYYVSLKCLREGTTGVWVIDTEQHMVDEDPNNWYFQYGIINMASNDFTETRGNAYMYGDNIVVGKIRTMDGKAYIDLTSNELNLGDQLIYKNGVLTIRGIPNPQSGGANLYAGGDLQINVNVTNPITFIKLCDLEAGKKYVASKQFQTIVPSEEIAIDGFDDTCIVIATLNTPVGDLFNWEAEYDWNESFEVNGNGRIAYIALARKALVEYSRKNNAYYEYPCDITYTIKQIMLQEGEKATGYVPYYPDSAQTDLSYLAQAFIDAVSAGTTTVTGALISTSLILMRDPDTQEVTAGLSGLEDDPVLLFGGGTYTEAQAAAIDSETNPIQTLIKKDGTGKIGIFRINKDEVIVKLGNDKIRINTTDGIEITRGEEKKIVVTRNSIENNIPQTSTISGNTETERKYFYYEERGVVDKYSFTLNEKSNVKFRFYLSCVFYKLNDNSSSFGATDVRYNHRVILKHPDNTTEILYSNQSIRQSDGNYQVLSKEAEEIEKTLTAGVYHISIDVVMSNFNMGISNPDEKSVRGSYVDRTEFSATISEAFDRTIIGIDGLLSVRSAEQYFMVKNNPDGEQKIIAKGLKSTKGTPNSGELYVSSNFIEAFKNFCDILHNACGDFRFVGSNKDHTTDIKDSIDVVRTQLTDTYIIASS